MQKFEFEKMLRKENRFNAEVLSDYMYNSYDGIFIVDKYGKLILANPAVIDMIGIPYNELIGNTVADIVDQGAYTGSPSTEAVKTGHVYTGLVKTRSGLEIMSTSKPIYNEEGVLQYVITNCRPLSVVKTFFDKFMKNESDFSDINYDFSNPDTGYVYSSLVMKDIIQKSFYAAKTDCAVMLLGQTGTGKGVMAKYIHESSKRSEEKFTEINCAALPENLLESELFGYEKGAFTGASNTGKKGLLEIANNGTVFLDEIGEMSLQLQAKLLKVLDSGYLLRVGGTIYHKINVRIISATNRNLRKMMSRGEFREDLFYRLNVISIQMPSLKDRKDEMYDIIEYLLNKTNKMYSTEKVFDDDALSEFMKYSWPGNIRQLDNFIQRAVILSMDETILKKSFISSLLKEESEISSEENEEALDMPLKETTGDTLKEYISRVETEYISKCIEECGGSITKAAEKLGIHRTAVYKKIKMNDEEE